MAKELVIYFSVYGTAKIVAEEIAKQTGADIFEIEPEKPYSESYNTVLREAQRDQHRHARPQLKKHVKNFEQYDI